uniref:Odorant-binding protein 8 n=1 Tax=Tropidothorax elegans TaxID=2233830 RepID=A0A2Z5EM71_9HEMI|nr:odorant-binding protein 8 [Tropidothorax elegans]
MLTNFICGFLFVTLSIIALAEDIPEECRPKPPPNVQKEVCCKIPKMMSKDSDIKNVKETMISCTEKLKNNTALFSDSAAQKKTPNIKYLECMEECVMESAGALKEGKIQVDAVHKMMSDFLNGDEAWKPVLDTAVKNCRESSLKNISSEAVCKSGSHQLSLCVMKDLYLHCPEKFWTDSEWCREEKSRVEKCSSLLMGVNSKM